MTWQGIHGHDAVAEQFRRSIARGRLASTYLFTGPAGIGKRTFAGKLAQALLCETAADEDLQPCGRCPSCAQVAAGTHPDLIHVARPEDKSSIPVELLIGDRQHRMRAGLCHEISLKPYLGRRKIALIDDADDLNVEGANCLLKTLEEPPPRSLLVLIGTSAQQQLPTIRSRSQVVRFRPLAAEVVERLLMEQEVAGNPDQARRLALYSDGSLQRAIRLADAESWKFREALLAQLAHDDFDAVHFARAVSGFVNEAGTQAADRRERSRLVFRFAVDYYRQLVRVLSGATGGDDAELQRAAQSAAATWRGDVVTAAACVDRCLAALDDVDRNANQTTLIECWLDDLSQLTVYGTAAGVVPGV